VHFKPFSLLPGLVVAPTWEQYEPAADEKVIVMDPGMAFGTGHHETTRLCLEMLSQKEALINGGTMLDVGTGTGILAIAALLYGASRVLAIDNDPEAVRAALANARQNNLTDRMEVSEQLVARVEGPFDFVAANIEHDVLVKLAGDLARVTENRGYLLLSGLIDGKQSENIENCFGKRGFQLVDKQTDGPWCALLVTRKE
jgi:ribosomal protein L11 methyltransferase